VTWILKASNSKLNNRWKNVGEVKEKNQTSQLASFEGKSNGKE
jgi:hypothetical protein